MGTSQSSSGPGSGVPLVPPWVPDPPPPAPGSPDPAPTPQNPDGGTHPPAPIPPNQTTAPAPTMPVQPPSLVASPGRFTGARRNLGIFAKSGNRSNLRRGVGQYIRSGYGGARTATSRFAGTSRTAGHLFSALSVGARGILPPPGGALDAALLQGKTVQVIINAVIEATRPTDGSQDAEASRSSINDSLAEVLTLYPEADLLNLSPDQKMYAVERYIASDVFRRFSLDLGKHIQDKASTATVAASRLKEAKDYIKETVAQAFRETRSNQNNLTPQQVSRISATALRDAFRVFEGYAE